MPTIGLIAAMPQESDALVRRLPGTHPLALASLRAKTFELSGQPYLLVTSGMGQRRATEAVRKLVELRAPTVLISFGIAGAVRADLDIGDVVLAESVCRLENGRPGACLPLAAWPEAARAAMAQALSQHGARLVTGTAVTTTGSQVSELELSELDHPILEMETFGIARVASEKGLPLLSLRAISDGPHAPLPFDLGEMMDADANLQVSRLLKAVLRRPALLLQARRLMRNTQLAADHAALALLAALSLSSPLPSPPAV
jgi:nucleoside phosphorylase